VAIIVIAHYYPSSIFGFLSGSSSASSGDAGAAAAPVLQTAATGAGAVAARAAAIAATNAAFAAGGIAALEGATLGLSLTVDLVSLGLAGALAAGQIGGAFTSAQQTELNKVENNVKQRLQNPQCAGVLGGLQKALALFNQALVLHANTINPAFGGSARAFRSVARQALAIANNSKSHLLAWSEIGGKYVYLNDRFFTYYPVNPAKEETVFIHELHRLGGFGGTDKADYAKITKGCGTPDPYAR